MRNDPTSFGAAPHAARGARRSLSSFVGVIVFLLVLTATAVLVSVAVLARISPAIERRVTSLFLANEAKGNTAFSLFKPLFGIELTGNAESLAKLIRERNSAGIQQLLDAGLAADSIDSSGNPAIRLAAELGFNEAVGLLLARGAKADARGADGSTALLAAIRRNNTALARVLLEKGAKVTLSADDATTPLMAAAQKGNLTLCELLVKGGSDLSAKNSTGVRALDYAVQSESLAVVELLVRSGASPLESDGNGETPLFKALNLRNQALTKALMSRGANFDSPTSSGRSVREQVFEKGMNILERPDGAVVLVPAAPGEMRGGTTDPSHAEVAAALSGDEEGAELPAEAVAAMPAVQAAAKPTATAAPSSTPVASTPAAKKLTRLRVVGELEGVWISSNGSLTLAHVSGNIRNVGDYAAENVQVSVTAPGGDVVKLKGPTVLQPYEQQLYENKSPGVKVRQEGKLRADLSCSNCRGKE